LQLDPDAFAYYRLGLTYDGMEKPRKAIEKYDQALKVDPNYANAYYGRGVAYEDLGQVEQAIADFERFIELSDNTYWIEKAQEQIREIKGDRS
jgi:tetratricopeptide (TPR) repeat protein